MGCGAVSQMEELVALGNLKAQQEASTNRIESNYIRKQQADEIKKQQQLEKDYEIASIRFNKQQNESINNSSTMLTAEYKSNLVDAFKVIDKKSVKDKKYLITGKIYLQTRLSRQCFSVQRLSLDRYRNLKDHLRKVFRKEQDN